MTQKFQAQQRYDVPVVIATAFAISTLAAGQNVPQLLPSPLMFCNNATVEVTCTQSDGSPDSFRANYLTIICHQSCPAQWQESRTRTPLDGGQYQCALTATFEATHEWDSVYLLCYGFSGSRSSWSRVIVEDEPSIKLEVTNHILWAGHRQTVTCKAEMYCGKGINSSIQWVVNCTLPGGCIFAITHRDNTSLEISFNATAEWNGSSVQCSLENGGLWLSPSQTLHVYDSPKLVLLPERSTYLTGDNVTLICEAADFTPPGVDLSLHWFCQPICPGALRTPQHGYAMFEATREWNGIPLQCMSSVFAFIFSAPRMLNLIDVSVKLSQKQPIFVVGEHQLLTCRVQGNYSAVSLYNPATWSVVCPLGGCQYKRIEHTDGTSLSFNVTPSWNNASVTCYLRGAPMSTPTAEVYIAVTNADMSGEISTKLTSNSGDDTGDQPQTISYFDRDSPQKLTSVPSVEWQSMTSADWYTSEVSRGGATRLTTVEAARASIVAIDTASGTDRVSAATTAKSSSTTTKAIAGGTSIRARTLSTYPARETSSQIEAIFHKEGYTDVSIGVGLSVGALAAIVASIICLHHKKKQKALTAPEPEQSATVAKGNAW